VNINEGLVTTPTGITIEDTFNYGDEDGEIYFRDRFGEICMWTMDEIKEDPSVVAPIFNTIRLAFLKTPTEIRQRNGRSCPHCCPQAPQRDNCGCGGPEGKGWEEDEVPEGTEQTFWLCDYCDGEFPSEDMAERHETVCTERRLQQLRRKAEAVEEE
jgi:hypothetical protein